MSAIEEFTARAIKFAKGHPHRDFTNPCPNREEYALTAAEVAWAVKAMRNQGLVSDDAAKDLIQNNL